MNVNRVVLIGRLTKDPELRHSQSGTAVTTFSLALNSRQKKGKEWVDRVDYFDVVTYSHTAEACAQYLAKGKMAAVDGYLRLEQWEKDGTKHRVVRVVGTNVEFVDRPSSGPAREEPPIDFDDGTAPDDEIPF